MRVHLQRYNVCKAARMTVSLAAKVVSASSAAALAVALATTVIVAQPRPDRPRVMLRAQPSIAVAPARVVLTAELLGGADDFEEYYCPTVAWDWGDDTISESSTDCEPFIAGKSQIRRRFTVEHLFRREGSYKVYFHMKRKEKILGSASATIQVQPGGGIRP